MAILGQGASLLFKIEADSSDFKRDIKAVEATIGNIGSKFETFGGMAAVGGAVAVTAITAVATAAITGATALYNLTKSASEYGSIINDARDKTGLAAETLTTLKIAADNSGSSFDQVTGGIAKFAKLLGEARDGNDKAAASLKALGVTSYDLKTALDQATTSIFAAKDGTDQIVLSQKAFGKSGADLIPVIKQFGGNLSDATKEATRLGQTLSNADVKAADEFGDTLGTLSSQVKGITSVFALQFAPIITDALKKVSEGLATNSSKAREYGQNFAAVLRGIQIAVTSSTAAMIGSFAKWAAGIISYIDPVQNALLLTVDLMRKVGLMNPLPGAKGDRGTGDERDWERSPSIARETTTGGGGGGRGGGGGSSTKDTAEQKRQKEIQEQQAANGRALAAYRAFLDIQESELKQSLNNRLIDEIRYTKAVAEIQLKSLLFEQNQNEKLLKDERLNDKERTDAENQKLLLIRKIAKARIDIGNSVYEAIKKQTEQELKDLEKKLEDEEKIRQKARDKANAAADVDFQNRIKKRDARKERDPYNTGGPQQGANGDLDWQVPAGGDFITGVVDGLGAANEQLPIMQQLGQQLAATFGQVAQAVGAAVKSFVLFGTAGQSFRKFAAEVIASIAQMAIVQAVFELAQGFAMLALAWFTGNPKYKKSAVDHFTAAAVFGGIGGIAAGVGRGVAGNSFSNETNGGGSGGGSGGDAAGQPAPLQFTERFNGFEQRVGALIATATDRINEVTGAAGEQIQAFADKFGPVTPGHVVMAGAGDAGGAIFDAVNGHLSDDLRASSDFKRNSGDYN